MKTLLFVLVIALISPAAALSAGSVEVSGAYVRAVPKGVPNSAAYLKLENKSGKAVSLEAVKSDVARAVELHQHVEKDGMMRMEKVEGVRISPKSTFELRPKGHHVMLIGLTREIKTGDQVTLELVFSDGTRRKVKAPVRHPSEDPPHSGHQH